MLQTFNLLCPKFHELQRLYFCGTSRSCDICGRRNLECCLHCSYCDYDVCSQCEQQHTQAGVLLDAVISMNGFNGHSRTQKLKCPRHHNLSPLYDCRSSRYCDVCRRNYLQGSLHCELCDYDICSQCQQQCFGYIQQTSAGKNTVATSHRCGICKSCMQRLPGCGPYLYCDLCWRNNLTSSLKCESCDYDICPNCEDHYFPAAIPKAMKNSTQKKTDMKPTTLSQLKKPDPNELNIVLLGPSGAGKSSLINLFYIWANEFQVGDLKKVNRVPIKTAIFDGDDAFERNIFNQKESCTQGSSTYSFSKKNSSYNLRFIDTPGIGDTRGIAQDDENILDICEQIQKLGWVSAIFLVVNGSEARFCSRLQYVLKKIEGIIPDDFLSNVFVLFTHVNSKPNVSADLFKPLGLKNDRIFTLNNQLFLLSKEELNSEKYLKRFSLSFTDCLDVLTVMFDSVTQCKPKITGGLKEVKEYRKSLNKYCEKLFAPVSEDQKSNNDLITLLGQKSYYQTRCKMNQYEYSLSIIQGRRNQQQNQRSFWIQKIQRRAEKIKKICSRFNLVKEIETSDALMEEELMVLTALKSEKGASFEEEMLRELKERRKKMQLLYKALQN